MKHLGDITKLNGHELPIVDIITGGSPCQDLSVAGKRAGLAGERSGLFMEQIRIIKEMRDESRKQKSINGSVVADIDVCPRYMVWENVPGAFSSNAGEDFRAVLEETARISDKDAVIPRPAGGSWSSSGCILGDGWSLAWRVHDAQFWGVPQRRKRISLVADFGGESAPEILFERKSVSGDSQESRSEGESSSETVGRGIEKTIEPMILESSQDHATVRFDGISTTLPASAGMGGGYVPMVMDQDKCLNSWDVQSKHIQPEDGIAETLYSAESRYGGGESYVMQHKPDTIVLEGNGSRPSHKCDGYTESNISYTLNSTEQHSVCYRKQGHPQTSDQGQGWEETDINDTLNAFDQGESRTPTVVMVENHPQDSRVKLNEDGVCQTLSNRMGTGGGNVPMVLSAEGFDNYNMNMTGTVGKTLQAEGGGSGVNEGCVLVSNTTMSDVAASLSAADGPKGPSSQQLGNPEENFVISNVCTTSKASYMTNSDGQDIGQTLVATDYKDPQIVAYGIDRAAYNAGMKANFGFSVEKEKIATQTAMGPGAVCQSIVRRLTPLECERLQGYPDGWTDIGDWVDSTGKKHKGDSDSARYKALGNSIALPFWQWMADRMVGVLQDQGIMYPRMASLFSGIGGFELVFTRSGAIPVWNSEIESFPEAVTKLRFGDD